MKKLLSTTLALAMLAGAMTVSAGAVYSDGPNSFTSANNADNSGNQNIDPRPTNHLDNAGIAATTGEKDEPVGEATIPVKLQTGGAGNITHVYAVTYDVTELNFTYGKGSNIIWNPETLQYETNGPGGGWGVSEQTITVTNYSDLPVKVTATVQNKTDNGITFTPDGPLELGTAAINGTTGTGKEQSGEIKVTATGTPIGSYTQEATKIADLLLTVTNNVA